MKKHTRRVATIAVATLALMGVGVTAASAAPCQLGPLQYQGEPVIGNTVCIPQP
jgi:ABC-type sugar transport system substrate-binding protein